MLPWCDAILDVVGPIAILFIIMKEQVAGTPYDVLNTCELIKKNNLQL